MVDMIVLYIITLKERKCQNDFFQMAPTAIFSTSKLHSKMCNVRLPYIKHVLNVHFKTYV